MDAQGQHYTYIHEAMLIQEYTRCLDWVCVGSEICGTNLVCRYGFC